MNLANNKNIQIFLLTSIGLITFPHLWHLPPAISGFFALLLLWRFLVIWKPESLPKGILLFFLAACGMAILYQQFHGFMGRDAGTSLFLVALGLKLMELRTEREFYLVNYLAFIVAASQFLYEQSILMAAYILLVSCVLLAALVFINSHAPRTWLSMKKAGVIIAQAIPMAIIVFIFFPRVEAPKWLFFNDQHQARMGLSDSMEPGSITDLGMSDELVFRVKFSGAIPPPQQRYWRGPVFTYTNGKRWLQSSSPDYQRYQDKVTFSGTPYHYTLLMEPQDKNWVFGLDLPSGFPDTLSSNANYQLISTDELNKRTEYKLTSYPDYNTGFITKTEYQQARQLPKAPSDKIKQLVQKLNGFNSDPEGFIQQLLQYFRQEDFHYTLTPPLMEVNPIETFLFETRHGFCSHYASAFVYLMRVANIPARVVTGYQGGEFNTVGGFLEVRQADAHAWAEVWLENRGWQRFDPTAAIAPERIERGIDINRLSPGGVVSFAVPSEGAKAAFDWLKRTRQLWSNIDYNWQRWVINYNTANQSNFLSSFGISDFKKMVYWMMALVAVITAMLSLILLYRRPQPVNPELKIYNRFLKKLKKVGFEKQLGEGARDFAERIKTKLPKNADDIEAITVTFIAQHYGNQPTKIRLNQLEILVRNIKLKI